MHRCIYSVFFCPCNGRSKGIYCSGVSYCLNSYLYSFIIIIPIIIVFFNHWLFDYIIDHHLLRTGRFLVSHLRSISLYHVFSLSVIVPMSFSAIETCSWFNSVKFSPLSFSLRVVFFLYYSNKHGLFHEHSPFCLRSTKHSQLASENTTSLKLISFKDLITQSSLDKTLFNRLFFYNAS